MSALGQAIAYSASNRVTVLSKVVHAAVVRVFQQHRGFMQLDRFSALVTLPWTVTHDLCKLVKPQMTTIGALSPVRIRIAYPPGVEFRAQRINPLRAPAADL